jgi:hypothetical protein
MTTIGKSGTGLVAIIDVLQNLRHLFMLKCCKGAPAATPGLLQVGAAALLRIGCAGAVTCGQAFTELSTTTSQGHRLSQSLAHDSRFMRRIT